MNLEKFRNKFIVGEGVDATGKTSVLQLLTNHLNNNGIETVFTYQPGDPNHGPLAPIFRSFCKDKRWNLENYTNMFIFLADRCECVAKVIRPALKAHKTVICDRHTYSTIAYQLYGKELIRDLLKDVGKETTLHLLHWFREPYEDVIPNIIYYFPEKVGSRENDTNDLFDNENNTFEKRVKDAYEEMSTMVCLNGRIDRVWKTVLPGNSAEETLENLLKL